MKFHELFKQKRMEHGTVRQFAKQSGLDVAYVSRLENGITMPPKDSKKLEHLGLALGLTPGTNEWQEFTDLAAVAKNELPEDLQDDERIMSMLPAFYNFIRDEKSAQKLLDLIKSSDKK